MLKFSSEPKVDVNRTNPPSKKLPRPPPSTAPQSKLLKSDSPPPPAPPKKALTIEEGFARQSHISSLANRRVPHSGPASSAPSKLQTKVLLPKPRATITITPHNVASILKNPSPRSHGAFPLSTPLRNSNQRDEAGVFLPNPFRFWFVTQLWNIRNRANPDLPGSSCRSNFPFFDANPSTSPCASIFRPPFTTFVSSSSVRFSSCHSYFSTIPTLRKSKRYGIG